MKKLTPRIKGRIRLLKSFGKKKGKDYFITEVGNLVIKKANHNEIVRAE